LSVRKLRLQILVSSIYVLSSLLLLPFHNLKKLEKDFLATESGHEPKNWENFLDLMHFHITFKIAGNWLMPRLLPNAGKLM
jgi:hypothetical protein